MIKHEDIDNGPLTSRLHKVCCCHSGCLPCNFLFRPCRKAVSGKKRRYFKGTFDLDLVYIEPNIIVHGFPAAGLEHVYRNPRYEIRRFMDEHHSDKYKMFNFCCEYGRGYDPEIFHGRVERYPFKDHFTPPLKTMVDFANSAKEWLDADPEHVVNMHCKAGKGRAGLMCCVLLVRTGYAQSARQAMDLYDERRVTNNRGLTVVSQRKFVLFYERLWRSCWGVTGDIGKVSVEASRAFKLPVEPAFTITGFEVLNFPSGLAKYFRFQAFKVTNFIPEKVYDSGFFASEVPVIDVSCLLEGNFKVQVQYKASNWSSPVKLMELGHNTYFMDGTLFNGAGGGYDFPVEELDIKRKMMKKLTSKIQLRLRTSPTATSAGSHNSKGYEMVSLTDSSAGVSAEDRSSL